MFCSLVIVTFVVLTVVVGAVAIDVVDVTFIFVVSFVLAVFGCIVDDFFD